MLDVSWGEIGVLAVVGLTLLGRRDLPPASRALGYQVGRIVGLLRGARLRADRYATDHHLRKLQNEFKSGLRELDAVKAELAGSMMMQGGGGGGVGGGQVGGRSVGGGLGASVTGVDRIRGGVGGMVATTTTTDIMTSPPPLHWTDASSVEGHGANLITTDDGGGKGSSPVILAAFPLAPRSRSVAAVAEEEWEKRGIGFRSIAEGGGDGRGVNNAMSSDSSSDRSYQNLTAIGGAVILSNYLRQSLIYDQYDRTLREQDEALRSRVEKVRSERNLDVGKEGKQ